MTLNEMQTPGAILRNRRQERGITLEDVAARTRIRRLYLQALEEDSYELLPGEAYRAGFLRIYAELLDLDPAEVMGSQSPPPALHQEPTAPSVSRTLGLEVKGKKTFLLVLGTVGLIFAAVTLAGLLRSPSLTEDGPAITVKTDASLAIESSDGPLVKELGDEKRIGKGSISGTVQPFAESMERPQFQAASAQGETPESSPTESIDIAPLPQEKTISSPVKKSGEVNLVVERGILRVEATGATKLILKIDELEPRTYNLIQGAQLSWKFNSTAHLHAGDPAKLKLWTDDQPLELSGRQEVLLSTVGGLQ